MRRGLAYLFGVLAAIAAGYDIWRGPGSGAPLEFTSTAEIWADIHRTSLIGLNSFTEKRLSPDIWDAVILPALTLPAWGLAGGLAAVLFVLSLIGRRRRRARGG